MQLILPICGMSTRFNLTRPKFLLTHPSGNSMVTEGIRNLDFNKINDIIIIALIEHENKYKFSEAMVKEIQQNYQINPQVIFLPKQTSSQPETIYEGLKVANINDSIFIKDCDNQFTLKLDDIPDYNFVSVIDLEKIDNINAGNKSYVNIGSTGTITNIAEKKVISNLFCCGGYFFKNSQDFMKTYEQLKDNKNLYVSHIVYKMILNDEIFHIKEATDFSDWGTFTEWTKYKNQFQNILTDIDGVLVYNSGKGFGDKVWGETEGIKKNIDRINNLYDEGKSRIILTTSRDEEHRYITEQQLKRVGLKYHQLVMGLLNAKRILINDFSLTNKFPSSVAINLERDKDTLENYI
jgi:hypothetical protein